MRKWKYERDFSRWCFCYWSRTTSRCSPQQIALVSCLGHFLRMHFVLTPTRSTSLEASVSINCLSGGIHRTVVAILSLTFAQRTLKDLLLLHQFVWIDCVLTILLFWNFAEWDNRVRSSCTSSTWSTRSRRSLCPVPPGPSSVQLTCCWYDCHPIVDSKPVGMETYPPSNPSNCPFLLLGSFR